MIKTFLIIGCISMLANIYLVNDNADYKSVHNDKKTIACHLQYQQPDDFKICLAGKI